MFSCILWCADERCVSGVVVTCYPVLVVSSSLVDTVDKHQEWACLDAGSKQIPFSGTATNQFLGETTSGPRGERLYYCKSENQYTTPTLVNDKELRLLQELFLILIVVGIGMRAIDRGSLVESIVGGGVIGGFYFLPVNFLFY